MKTDTHKFNHLHSCLTHVFVVVVVIVVSRDEWMAAIRDVVERVSKSSEEKSELNAHITDSKNLQKRHTKVMVCHVLGTL